MMLNSIPGSILCKLNCHTKDKKGYLVESTMQNIITFQQFLPDL